MNQSRKIAKAIADFKSQPGTHNMATIARYVAKEISATPDRIALQVSMSDPSTFVLEPKNLYTAVCLYHSVPYTDVSGKTSYSVSATEVQSAGAFENRNGSFVFVRDEDSAMLPCTVSLKA